MRDVHVAKASRITYTIKRIISKRCCTIEVELHDVHL